MSKNGGLTVWDWFCFIFMWLFIGLWVVASQHTILKHVDALEGACGIELAEDGR